MPVRIFAFDAALHRGKLTALAVLEKLLGHGTRRHFDGVGHRPSVVQPAVRQLVNQRICAKRKNGGKVLRPRSACRRILCDKNCNLRTKRRPPFG